MPLRLLAATLALLACAPAADAALILGVSSSQSGPGAQDNGIYLIDTATGGSSLLGVAAGGGANDVNGPNGLAFAGGNAYYSTFGPGASQFWKLDIATGTNTQIGTLVGDVASGTAYRGDYYYMNQVGDLYRVALGGPPISTLVVAGPSRGFGDIAVSSAGILYGSSSTGFFKIDLNSVSPSIQVISNTTTSPMVQLAFDPTGTTLFGLATANDRIYRINTTTGVYTQIGTLANSGLRINDLATVPEPSSLALMGIALTAAAGHGWRRRRLRRA